MSAETKSSSRKQPEPKPVRTGVRMLTAGQRRMFPAAGPAVITAAAQAEDILGLESQEVADIVVVAVEPGRGRDVLERVTRALEDGG